MGKKITDYQVLKLACMTPGLREAMIRIHIYRLPSHLLLKQSADLDHLGLAAIVIHVYYSACALPHLAPGNHNVVRAWGKV